MSDLCVTDLYASIAFNRLIIHQELDKSKQ